MVGTGAAATGADASGSAFTVGTLKRLARFDTVLLLAYAATR
jgi:hypothetical protein